MNHFSTSQMGECPKCKSKSLAYNCTIPVTRPCVPDQTERDVQYSFSCGACGSEGQEVWNMTFEAAVVQEPGDDD